MCLETKWKKPFVLKKDRECYIIVKITLIGVYSLFKSAEITNKMRSKLDNPDGEGQVAVGLHSFKFKRDAERFLALWKEENFGYHFEVVKCIIPAGSKYYAGSFMTFDMFGYPTFAAPSYVSNKRNLSIPVEEILKHPNDERSKLCV